MSSSLRERIVARLAEPGLRQVLGDTLGRARAARARAFAELPRAEERREQAARRRRDTINRLGPLLRRLEEQLTAAGTTVVWAEDAQQVRRWLAELISANKVRRVVLSKSMVGEEIGLEQMVRECGAVALQSDLGERVVQLARCRPSHLTAPCIHLSSRQVAEILRREVAADCGDDPESICRYLGTALRPHFFQAQMGITGVNLAVAESGTLVVVENEGNARMGYTLPPIHVAIMGLERVAADWEEAMGLLSLLARSATGQRTTAYTSFLPPSPLPGQQRFVVLVDNGRTGLFNRGPHRELLHCIRCGACVSHCPVYEQVGGHGYDWSYMGPIGVALAPFMAPPKAGAELPHLCTLCGLCGEVCPVAIPLDRLIVQARAEAVSLLPPERRRQERQELVWLSRGLCSRAGYRLSHWGHKVGTKLFPERVAGLAERLGWHSLRHPPAPAPRLFRSWHRGRKKG